MIYKRLLGWSIILGALAWQLIGIANEHGVIQALAILATVTGITFLGAFTVWLFVSK